MKIADEIKAKIVIEADTSGADEAAAALEKLQGLAGGEGGIGDALAEQFAKGNEEAGNFAEALGGSEEALKANEEAASEATQAMEDHQQAVEEAGSAHEQFQGQVEETANQLKEVPSSLNEVTKSTQAMSEQVAKSGDTLSTLSDNMANFAYANEGVASWWSDSMLAATEKTYSVLQAPGMGESDLGLVPETLWNAGEAAKAASVNVAGFATSTENANEAVQGFLGSDSAQYFSSIAPSAEDAQKAVAEFMGTTEDAGKTAEKTGGIFSDIFGEGGAVSELGASFGDIGTGFGNLMMGFDQFMRPLMMLQMGAQMIGAAGSYIYNANLAAEGPNAGSPSSFTSQVDQLNKTIQSVGDSFAVGVGAGLNPSLNAWNAGNAQSAGGPDFWKGLGEAVGGAGGGIVDIAQIVAGSIMSAIGYNGLTPDTSFGNQGWNMAMTGTEGLRNLWAQMTGQKLPFPGPGTPDYLTTQNPYYAGNTSSGVPSADYLQNPLSPYYGMTGSQAQASWDQSHYTGTIGPSDPMNTYEHIAAEAAAGQYIGVIPGPTPDITADQLYFGSMPYGTPGPSYRGSGGYGGTITNQDVANANASPGGFSNFTDPSVWSGIGKSIAQGASDLWNNNPITQLGTSAANATSGFFGDIAQGWHNLGEWMSGGNGQTDTGPNFGYTGGVGAGAGVGNASGMTNYLRSTSGGADGGGGSLEHTFTATVHWTEQNLSHEATAVAHWAEQGLIHAATAVANWAEQGVIHAVTAVANWAEQGVIHAVTAVANWAEQGVEHAVTAIANWAEQGLEHNAIARAIWSEVGSIASFVAKAVWNGENLINQFVGKAEWVGQNLVHTFVGIAQWVGQGLSQMFSATGAPMFAEGISGYEGGPAIVGEAGVEIGEHNGQFAVFDQGATFVNLPAGSSVYPMQEFSSFSSPRMLADGTGGTLSPVFLGSVGGGGPQTANIHVYLDSQTLISALGVSLAQNIRLGMGIRSY